MKNKLLSMALIVLALTGCSNKESESKKEEEKLLAALENATYYQDECIMGAIKRLNKESGTNYSYSQDRGLNWGCGMHNSNANSAFKNAVLNGVARVEIDNAEKRGKKAAEIDNAK